MRFLRLSLTVLIIFSLTGCAAGRKNLKGSDAEIKELNAQILELETEIDTKDKMIFELEARLEKKEVSPASKKNAKGTAGRKVDLKSTTKNIQIALKNAGLYDGSIDGKKGKETERAIKEFQKMNNLKADGIVGKKTWLALSKYLDKR